MDAHFEHSHYNLTTWFSPDANGYSDWALTSPYINRLTLPPQRRYPSYGSSFFLETSAYYVVISGKAAFSCNDGAAVYSYGDLFWIEAGTTHCIMNLGNDKLVLMIATTGKWNVFSTLLHRAPSGNNPSVNASWISHRGYRRIDGQWLLNPHLTLQTVMKMAGCTT